MVAKAPSVSDNSYEQVETPRIDDQASVVPSVTPARPTWVLYSSVFVPLLQPLLYGWSTGQLNLLAFNDKDECRAVPIADGTCLMFPGHTTSQWTLAVCAWIVGGMVGCLFSGRFGDRYGRRAVMIFNCLIIIAGSCVQASATSIWVFIAGRLISGVATGCATCVIPGYINEISPPELRSKLGVGFQMAIATGNLLVSASFFVADSSTGWRVIAGFPMVFAGLFLALSSFAVVESPVWLLSKHRTAEAHYELARLFGEDHCSTAVHWITAAADVGDLEMSNGSDTSVELSEPQPISKLFAPEVVLQLVTAIGIAGAQQLTGINAIFYYSSNLFESAGISDDRVGIIAVSLVNVLPTLFSGVLAARFGNYRLILGGMIGMFVSAVGMTVALVTSAPAFAIVFTASFVAVFGSSLGALAWVVMAELFPNELRASGTSVCVFFSWIFNLVVGVSYPFIESRFSTYSFVPFIGSTAIFFVFVYSMVPDTSGKTCVEIQREFRERRLKKIHFLTYG